jgi:hypothetical protein
MAAARTGAHSDKAGNAAPTSVQLPTLSRVTGVVGLPLTLGLDWAPVFVVTTHRYSDAPLPVAAVCAADARQKQSAEARA